jgi:hypothetical protein
MMRDQFLKRLQSVHVPRYSMPPRQDIVENVISMVCVGGMVLVVIPAICTVAAVGLIMFCSDMNKFRKAYVRRVDN